MDGLPFHDFHMEAQRLGAGAADRPRTGPSVEGPLLLGAILDGALAVFVASSLLLLGALSSEWLRELLAHHPLALWVPVMLLGDLALRAAFVFRTGRSLGVWLMAPHEKSGAGSVLAALRGTPFGIPRAIRRR